MKKIALIVWILVSAPSALASDCTKFARNFRIPEGGCVMRINGRDTMDQTYSGLRISFQKATQLLDMTYEIGGSSFLARFVADGKERAGDGLNSGKTYTAQCDADKLFTRRVFTQLKQPLLTTITLNSEGAQFIESFEGDGDSARICKMVPAI